MREGPYFPEHGLARVVEFHERQDARYAEAAADDLRRHRQADPRRQRARGHRPRQCRAARRARGRPLLRAVGDSRRPRARAPLAPCPTSPPDGGGVSTTTRRVLAGLLVVAAAIVAFVAFSGGDSGAGPATTATPEATTPLWSVRRVPEPVVDAVGEQHLQAALDAAAPGDRYLLRGAGGQPHRRGPPGRRPPHRCLDAEAARRRGGAGDPRTRLDLPDARRRTGPARRRHRRSGLARRRRRSRARHRRLRVLPPVAGQDEGRRDHQPRSPRRRGRRQGHPPDPRRDRGRRLALRHAAVPPDLEGHLPHRRRDRTARGADGERRVQRVVRQHEDPGRRPRPQRRRAARRAPAQPRRRRRLVRHGHRAGGRGRGRAGDVATPQGDRRLDALVERQPHGRAAHEGAGGQDRQRGHHRGRAWPRPRRSSGSSVCPSPTAR